MSRIGKRPIPLPEKTKAAISGRTVMVEGPKGKLQVEHHPGVSVAIEDDTIVIVAIMHVARRPGYWRNRI